MSTLVSGTGSLGAPISSIQFKGITFAHATWIEPSTVGGFAAGFANRYHIPNLYTGFPPGGVEFKTAHNIRFERCMFTHMGAEGLDLIDGSQNCVVTGCVFTDISSSCIRIGDVNNPVRSDLRSRDIGNQIINCYIHDAPSEYHGGLGIMAGYVSDLLVSRNEIANTPYSGISCGWGWGTNSYAQNNQFTYNNIHHFCQTLGDGGGIYTMSSQPNTKWNNNWFHDMPSRVNGGAIYPDEGSAGMEINNNVCSAIGNKWLNIWINTIQNINTHHNWTTTGNLLNNGTNCPVSNTVLISGAQSNWPAEAQSIANNAGIQSAFADIKNLPCACSLAPFQGIRPVISGNIRPAAMYSIKPTHQGYLIRFLLPNMQPVSIKVFGPKGELIAVLMDKELLSGANQVKWETTSLSAGFYIVRLLIGERVFTKRVLLEK